MAEHQVQSYAYLHNRILKQYRRASLYIIWVAILNIMAIALAAITLINAETGNGFGYGAFFNHVGLALIAINEATQPEIYMYLLYAFLLSIPYSGLFIFLGLQAYHGSRKCLYTSVVLYGLDTLLLVIVFFSYISEDGVLAIIIHIVIMAMLVLACYKRIELIDLSKKYLGAYEKKDVTSSRETTTMTFNISSKRHEGKKTVGEKLEGKDKDSGSNVENFIEK